MSAPSRVRRATNISLDADDVAEAKALGINVSRACETGLKAEIRRVADARWVEENRAAFEASNRWVEEHGLPLAKYRLF